jgi:hypothetical protein
MAASAGQGADAFCKRKESAQSCILRPAGPKDPAPSGPESQTSGSVVQRGGGCKLMILLLFFGEGAANSLFAHAC